MEAGNLTFKIKLPTVVQRKAVYFSNPVIGIPKARKILGGDDYNDM